ncbi:hypothetical protein [Planotetraspora silvatica]|uniref:hypothetical protein n=1 Tax=Planotetraspora silvatica TaxID=234614 RepID=UPI00194EECDA|nr:hypothetical protein [Planotetraspora silvatica]
MSREAAVLIADDPATMTGAIHRALAFDDESPNALPADTEKDITDNLPTTEWRSNGFRK